MLREAGESTSDVLKRVLYTTSPMRNDNGPYVRCPNHNTIDLSSAPYILA